MSALTRRYTSFTRPFGRFFTATADMFEFAREANEIAHTPENVFRARGTSRDQALRDLISRG